MIDKIEQLRGVAPHICFEMVDCGKCHCILNKGHIGEHTSLHMSHEPLKS